MRFDKFIYFYPENPVLVHRDQELVKEMSEDDNYVAEPKYNGKRLQLHVIDGRPQFFTRHGHTMKRYEPSKEILSEIKEKLPNKGYFLFDGELRDGKVTGIRQRIVLWGCFIYDGEFLNRLGYWARREYVKKHFDDKGRITVIIQHGRDFLKHFKDYTEGKHGDPDEFEGLVMKNLQGKLSLGRKTCPESNWMFKIRKETGRHKF